MEVEILTKLASELGVERYKIYSYLELLQGTYMIRLLPKFSKSIDRTVAGGRKIYFIDVIIDKKIACEIKLRGTKSDFKSLSRISESIGLSEKYIVNRYYSEEDGFIPAVEL